MKKIVSHIFKFQLFLLVTNFALGSSIRYNSESITPSFSKFYNLDFEYKTNFRTLDLSGITASQTSLIEPFVNHISKIKLISKGSVSREISECPTDIVVSGDSVMCGAIVTWPPPTPSSSLYEIEQVGGPASGSLFPYGITVITYEEQFSGTNIFTGELCTFNIIVLDVTAAAITLTGQNPQIIEACDSYSELGATATDPCIGDISPNLAINTSAVNTNAIGSYIVRYNVQDANGNVATEVTRTVNVVDTTIPTITLIGANPQILPVCDSYSELGATANDPCFGDISGNIVIDATAVNSSVVGTYNVIYNVTDANTNAAIQVTRVINVVDTTAPVPNVASLPIIENQCSATLIAPTATDDCGRQITGTTSNPLTYNSQGNYTITWTYNDGNGNSSSQTQSVVIDDTTNPITPILADINVGQCSGAPPIPTTTDTCSGTISGTTTTTFPITAQGITVVTWNFDDGNGNSINVSQNVIVDDTTNPIRPTLANITVGQCEGTPPTPSTTDVCSGPIIGTTTTTFPITAQGLTVVTWTFDDGNGNVITVDQNVTVNDTTKPITPTLPAIIVGECSGTPPIPTTTDACAGLIYGTTSTPFPITSQSNITVVWTFDDGNGNFTTASQSVRVDDTIAPVPDIETLPTLTGECSVTDIIPPTATDNCRGQIIGTTTNNLTTLTSQRTTVITWRFNDSNGNTSTQTQTVIVDDITPPVPNVADLPTLTGECSVSNIIPPTATDNCRGQITATRSNPLNYTVQGTYTITWRYNDSNGNTSTQTQMVIVDDITAPVPNVTDLPTITGQCSVTGITRPTATDNCRNQITATTSNPLSYTAQGTYVITWIYNDTYGNTSSQTQTILVQDTVAPVPNVTSLPTITGQCSVTSITRPKATDICKGQITATTSNPLSYTTQGTYVITWVYDDTYGNTSSQTQTVIVQDTIAPVPNITNLPTITGQCSVTSITRPTATDNCKGQITATTLNPLIYTAQGTYVITWVYDDTYGNTSSQIQTVIIRDSTAPVADITFLPTINAQCSVTVTAPTASDNCSGSIIGTTTNPVTYSSQGNYTITWTYNDGNGNTTTQSQNVIVKDTQLPNTLTLPNLTAECSLTLTPPTTSDNCDGIITGTTGLTSLTINSIGTDIIYWEFRDQAGNSIIVPQNITITDSAPVPNASTLSPQVFSGCQITNINSLVRPTATDACDGQITGTLSPNFVFPYSFSGTETIDWEFRDSHGNVTFQSQNITLNPISVDGGALKGTFQSTVFTTGIDISSCAVAISVALNLSGQVGTIVRWEKFAVNQGVWEVIPNTTQNYTASFGIGALISTYYRVLIQTGTCIAYSNQFFIRALPTGSAPVITNMDADAFYCLGDQVSLLATSTYTATQETIPDSAGEFNQGQLNTQDPNGWLVDGDPGGFTAGGSATKPRNWSGKTCNNQANGDIVYCGTDGKYSMAYGDFSSNQYRGAIPTTLETPILDFSNAQSASLDFDQAFYFANGDYANIEISTAGGAPGTYTTLRLMHAPGSGIKRWFTAGTAESLAGSDATHYNFETDNTSIDLSAYLGQSNIRIRWSFTGTTNKSAWALDNIFANKNVVVDTDLEWTDGIGNPNEPPIADGQTEVAFVFTPDAPGHHQYGTTALINNCRTYDTDGTALIDIFVSYSHAGDNVAYLSQACGQNTVRMNAYDNRKTARENANKGAYTLPTNCANCDDEGTGAIGTWSISANSACGGGTFSDINDPDAIFTGEAGTYTLTWTVAGCASSINVTTTNCNQIDFDGTNDYVDFENNNFHFDSGNFSIESWIKPKSLSGTQTIFSKRNGDVNNSGYDLSVNNSGIVSFNFNGTGVINSAPYKITNERWYHISLTYSGGRYTLYIDGIEINSNTGSRPQANSFRALLGAVDDNSSQNPKKHFNGWIDEFRVWNVGLTPEQLRSMMNQKIISSPTVSGNVQGEIIPVDISGLRWSNLTAYFQMEPTQVACGYLNSTSSLIKGRLRNITSSEAQTAPIPYTSRIDGTWDNDTTWTNHLVWDVPNSTGINGAAIDWNIVRTGHNISSGNKDITVLGLLVDANELSIEDPTAPFDETNDGQGLWVTHYLKIDGVIDLVGESQLIQKRYSLSQFNESILDVASSGKLERDRQGTANLFNYNYWSSPVSPVNTTANNTNFSIGGVLRDGTNSSAPLNLQWTTAHNAIGSTSPKTMSSRWLYSYRDFPQNSYSSWVDLDQNSSIQAGLGFTMKGSGAGTAVQNYVFEGKPNNGSIVNTVSPNNQALVGNPYPSAIDANEFIRDNIPGGNPGSSQSIDGSLYFWEHYTSNTTHVYELYEGSYAVRNLIGGLPAVIPDGIIGAGASTKTPGQFIPVGQSFFVTASTIGGPIAFHNDQRIFVREAAGSSVFMRQSNPNVSADSNEDPNEIQRLRLKFSSNGLIRPLLLGFTPDNAATDGFDYGYDALFTDEFPNDMFWSINGDNYIIQGVGAYDEEKVYPLNINISNSGSMHIELTDLENFDSEIDVFVYDSLLDTYHQINTNDFTMTLDAGNYDNRFFLTFTDNNTLSVEEIDSPIALVNYLMDTEEIYVKTPSSIQVKQVYLINLLGQTVKSWNMTNMAMSNEIRIPANDITEGTYIVKVETDGATINKKVIIKY